MFLLTVFSSVYIKCKKLNLMQKSSGNEFLKHLGEQVFLGRPPIPEFLWIMLQYLIQALYNMEDEALCDKK